MIKNNLLNLNIFISSILSFYFLCITFSLQYFENQSLFGITKLVKIKYCQKQNVWMT